MTTINIIVYYACHIRSLKNTTNAEEEEEEGRNSFDLILLEFYWINK